jgi:hypothetical protein
LLASRSGVLGLGVDRLPGCRLLAAIADAIMLRLRL